MFGTRSAPTSNSQLQHRVVSVVVLFSYHERRIRFVDTVKGIAYLITFDTSQSNVNADCLPIRRSMHRITRSSYSALVSEQWLYPWIPGSIQSITNNEMETSLVGRILVLLQITCSRYIRQFLY